MGIGRYPAGNVCRAPLYYCVHYLHSICLEEKVSNRDKKVEYFSMEKTHSSRLSFLHLYSRGAVFRFVSAAFRYREFIAQLHTYYRGNCGHLSFKGKAIHTSVDWFSIIYCRNCNLLFPRSINWKQRTWFGDYAWWRVG